MALSKESANLQLKNKSNEVPKGEIDPGMAANQQDKKEDADVPVPPLSKSLIRICTDFVEKLINDKVSPENLKTVLALIQQTAKTLDSANRGELLKLAAAQGKGDHLRVLLEVEGTDINAKSTFCETALTTALENGHINCVEILLDAGAILQVVGFFAKPIMACAEGGGCEKAFLALLDKKLNQKKSDDLKQQEEVKELEESHLVPVKDKPTPFPLIESSNKEELFDFLNKHLMVSDDNSPIMLAMMEQAVFALGKEYEATKRTSFLFEAAHLGKKGFLKLLLKDKGRVNQANIFFDTPLTVALSHGHVDCAEILIEAGAKFQFEGFYAGHVMECAKRGNCERAFQDFLDRRAELAGQVEGQVNEANEEVDGNGIAEIDNASNIPAPSTASVSTSSVVEPGVSSLSGSTQPGRLSTSIPPLSAPSTSSASATTQPGSVSTSSSHSSDSVGSSASAGASGNGRTLTYAFPGPNPGRNNPTQPTTKGAPSADKKPWR